MKTSHYLFAIVFSMLAVAQLTSCNDDPDTEFMYVMKSQYASDYLKESPRFSKFTQIVTRSKMMDLLGTYGSYTVFAPTNEAIQHYLGQGRKVKVNGLGIFKPSLSSRGIGDITKWNPEQDIKRTYLLFTPETETANKKRVTLATKKVSWELAEVAVDSEGNELVGRKKIREAKGEEQESGD